jgi:hypothetical protein
MSNKDLPRPVSRIGEKSSVLEKLRIIDKDIVRSQRILNMENELRANIDIHLKSLPTNTVSFSKLYTSPYVLLFYSKKRQYSLVSQLEKDIVPAKIFSSIETAAGNIIQKYVMPIYGWKVIDSSMQSQNSVIDIMKKEENKLKIVTLKSGPRCLNDGMSQNIAQEIVDRSIDWAKEYRVDHIEFVYGVLYGTEKTSNKKDWHILRNISEMKGSKFMKEFPANKWSCSFQNQGASIVDVKIKIGKELWEYINDDYTMLETAIALIRANVIPAGNIDSKSNFAISEFADIISIDNIGDFNISLLQKSQLQWMFFYLRHFYDILV